MSVDPITLAWRKIEWELYQLDPVLVKRLPPGATHEALASAEAELEVRFPVDVRRYFQVHDGFGSGMDFSVRTEQNSGLYLLMPLHEMVRSWKTLRDIGADLQVNEGMFSEPMGPIKSSWYDRAWIPFTDNCQGDHHCMDFSPEEGGEVGQIIFWWHEKGATEIVAYTFLDWFTALAEGLASGEYSIHPQQ